MASPPTSSSLSKQEAFEELFNSSQTIHVSLKNRPSSVTFATAPPPPSLPPISPFTIIDDGDQDPRAPDELPSLQDLTIKELEKAESSGALGSNSPLELIKRAVRAKSRIPVELFKDEALADDLKLLCSEYNAVVEDLREEMTSEDMTEELKQNRRKSFMFEFPLSFFANGILNQGEGKTAEPSE